MYRILAAFLAVSLLACAAMAAGTTAAYQNSFEQVWGTNLGGEVRSVRIVEAHGDTPSEVVADSIYLASYGRSGTIFAFSPGGQKLWEYRAGLLYASYTSPDGYTVSGAGPYVDFISPNGQNLWKRATRNSPVETIFDQSVYAADVNHDGKDEAFIGTNLGTHGNELSIRGNSGDEIGNAVFKSIDFPNVIYSADLKGTGRQDVMIGTLMYTPNTVSSTQAPAYSKPSSFKVLDLTGALLWSDPQETAVTAIKVCYAGDGTPEILVGSLGKMVAYTQSGKRSWFANVDGPVNAIDCGNLEGNGSLDIAVGAGKLYLLRDGGKELWTYSSGQINAVKIVDFGKTGKLQVVAASNSLRVLDSKGALVYKTDNYGIINSVDVGLIGEDIYPSIVFGSADHNLRVISAKKYCQEMAADDYLAQADKAYSVNDYNLSAYYAQNAAELYALVGKDSGKMRAQGLIDKSTRYSDGDRYYNLSLYYFNLNDFDDAIANADKAIAEYSKLSDLHKVADVQEIKTKASIVPNSAANLNLSKQAFAQRNFANASDLAQKAKAGFVYLNDPAKAGEADAIINKSNTYLEFFTQVDMAYNYTRYDNHDNATYHLNLAKRRYDELNDSLLAPVLENVSSTVNTVKRNEDVIVWGSIGVVAFILLLILALIGLVAFYFFQKGGFAKLFEVLGEYAGWMGESMRMRPGSKEGLKGLRGREGESIGDSFKRR